MSNKTKNSNNQSKRVVGDVTNNSQSREDALLTIGLKPVSVLDSNGLKIGVFNFDTADNKKVVAPIPLDSISEEDLGLLLTIKNEISQWYTSSFANLFENREDGVNYLQRPTYPLIDLHLAINNGADISTHNFIASQVISALFQDVVKQKKSYFTTAINILTPTEGNPIFLNYFINPITGEAFIFGPDPLEDGRIFPKPISNTVLSPVKVLLTVVQDIAFRTYINEDPVERGTYFDYIYDMGGLARWIGAYIPGEDDISGFASTSQSNSVEAQQSAQ